MPGSEYSAARRPMFAATRGRTVPVLLLIVLGFATTGPAVAEPETDSGRITAYVFETSPTLDGNLADWPQSADAWQPVRRPDQVLPARRDAWGGVQDLSAKLQVGVDTEALYLALHITDDKAFHPRQPWWHGDAVELFLDLGYEPGTERPQRFTDGCWQIFLMPRNPELSWGVAYHGTRRPYGDAGLRGLRVVRTETEAGYDLEARLPLVNFGIDATGRREIGFALALDDADEGPGLPGNYLSWNGRFELYLRPDHYGTLVLPARTANVVAPTSDGLGSPLLWALLAAALAVGGVLLLAGPAARAFSRLGPMPKVVGIGLTGLLAVVFVVDADRTESRAEQRVRDNLEELADEARGVARDAAVVGALSQADAADRTRVLTALLQGQQVPAVLPPAAIDFVRLQGGDTWSPPPQHGHELSLDRPRTFYLPREIQAEGLNLRLRIESHVAPRDEVPGPELLGELILLGTAGATRAYAVSAAAEDEAPQQIEIELLEGGPWSRIEWRPLEGAPRAVLLGITARKGPDLELPLWLSAATEDGIPILGGPGTPYAGRTLEAGETVTLDLPDLLGADRLWIVLTASGAFPHTLGDETTIATVEVIYDREENAAVQFPLRNAEHVATELVPRGISRPPNRSSRTAYRWTDIRGQIHAHDAIALPLDPDRVAKHLSIVNGGSTGALRVVAATVVRSGAPPQDSRIGIAPGSTDGADLVFVVRPTAAFADHLGPGREGGANGAGRVRLESSVGPDEAPTLIVLAAPLPLEVERKRERTHVALLTCLAIALVLLAFLAADAVERFRRLTWRLAFAVLVAALVPLAATILLVDQTTRDRLESGHAARARTALAAVQASLSEALRRTHDDALHLARHLMSSPVGLDPQRTADLVRLNRQGALPPEAAGLAIIRESGGEELQIPPARSTPPLCGPSWLAERRRDDGFHVSPWDGLVLVGSARSGGADRWVHVLFGVRADAVFLRESMPGATSAQGAAVAILDASGMPLVATGTAADDFRAALARRRGAFVGPTAIKVLRRVDPVGAEGRPRLAVVSRLEGMGMPGKAPWLVVGLDRTAIDSALKDQREQLAWLALFGIVLVVGVAGLTARRVADPVKGLVRVTEAVRRGEFDVEVPPAGTDEVGDLTIAFDQMRHDLKQRVGDLDFLGRAQGALAGSLDHARRAKTVVDLMREAVGADAVVLLDATSAGGPLTVAAEHGRRTTFGDRAFHAAPGGWMEHALQAEELVAFSDPSASELVTSEGPMGGRLVEDRPAWLALPLRTGGEVAGLVVLAFDDPATLPGRSARRLLEPLAGVCALALHNARLYRLAALDDVTGLPGATAFEAALRADVERSTQQGPPVMLLRVGLDHVEHVTLRRGVEIARELVRALALALREGVGDRAQLGRLREDELAVRLPGATREEALDLADAVRERLARVEVVPEEGGEPVGSTVTVGTARGPDDATSLEFLLDAAGRALMAARREGGDRVEDAARLDAGLVDLPPYEEGTVVRSERMVRVVDAARRAARTDTSILVTGETGTGKEVIANLVHRRSVRAERPFVKVNCAAFPETLLESELFGYERGAFTGADRRREGRFELADGGTLFLDEIAEMSSSAQVRLLRVLQERQFTRLGGTRTVNVDVRILAATNRDIENAVASGAFREDLYYRLNVIRLDLPPLRERREEIPHLVDRFIVDAARRVGRGPQRLSSAAMDILYRHPWPGNVRELKNVIERCVVLCDTEEAGPEHLQLDGGRDATTAGLRAAPRDDLNERQQKLLDHLARHGRCTNREYYEMTGTSPRTGLRDLQSLMNRGLLVREGKRRGAVYRLP